MLISSLPQKTIEMTLDVVKSHKENLLNALNAFKSWLGNPDSTGLDLRFPRGVDNGFLLTSGLCANIGNINLFRGKSGCGHFIETVDYKINLHRIFELWPKFSGSMSYPVPSCNNTIGMAMFGPQAYESLRFSCAFSLYDASEEYGALRLELLDFIIECIEKDFRKFVRIDQFSY